MSADPFVADAQRRENLEREVIAIRIALSEAREARDGDAALVALDRLYAFRERYPEIQVVYAGDDPKTSTAFALANTCVQLVARWGGICSICDDRFSQGDVIYWDKEERVSICARCSIQEFHGADR